MWHPASLSDFEIPQNENNFIQETNNIYEISNGKQEDICQIDNEGITGDICKYDMLEGQDYQNNTINHKQNEMRKEEMNLQQYDQSLLSGTESFALLNDTLRLKDLPTSAQPLEQQLKRTQSDQQNEHNSMTNTEILQMKIVNEIFDFDEQQFQMASENENMNNKASQSAALSQQSSSQTGLMMDTNLVDFGRQIGSSTIKNLFEGTTDLQGMMANMERTEDNNRLFEELNELNKTIKTIEELLMNQSKEQKDLIQLKRNQPRQLKEELSQKNIQLRSLTRELIKLENERERQRQAEGELRKQIDLQFEKENKLLENKLTGLERNKQAISKELEVLEEKWHCLQERKSTGKEELMAKLMQRAEMVAQMEDLEEMKDDFQLRFPLETQCMVSILQFNDEIEIMVNQQQEIRNKLNQQGKSCKIQTFSNVQISSSKTKQIEELITKKCLDLGCSQQVVSSLFIQLFDSRSLELSKETLQRQIILIEKEQLKLDEQLKTTASIQQLNSSRCSSTNNINNNNSPQHSLCEMNQMEELSNKSSILIQWKEKAQEHLDLISKRTAIIQQNSSTSFTFDRILLEELLKRQLHHLGITCDSCDIAFLGDLYEQYFQELSSLLANKQSNEEYTYSNDVEETNKLELELHNISNNIQSKQSEINSKRAILQGLLVQQADEAFNDYMVQQKQVFDGLESTYGKIVLQQIKQNHHQQFRHIMQQDQDKRFKSIEDITICMNKMHPKIKRNIDYVEMQLSDDICNVQNDIVRCSQEINKLDEEQRNSQNIIEECQKQLGIVKQQKEQALQKQLQLELLFMSAGSYEKKKQSLQLQIENVESSIRNIEVNLKEAFERGIEQQQISQRGGQQQQQQQSEQLHKQQLDISETALKRQLDELLIQRFALESRLIEINFDIQPLDCGGGNSGNDINCFPDDLLNGQLDISKQSNILKSQRYQKQPLQQSINRSPNDFEQLNNNNYNTCQGIIQKDSIQTITEEQLSSQRDATSKIEIQRIPKTNGYLTLPVYKRNQDENESINNLFDKSCQIFLNDDNGVSKQNKQQQMKHHRSRSVILQKQLTHLDHLSNHNNNGSQLDNTHSNIISFTGNQQQRQLPQQYQQPSFQQENVCPNTATHKNKQITQLFNTNNNNNNIKKDKLTIPAPLDTNSSYFFTPNATPNTLPLSFNTYLNSTVKNARPKQINNQFNPQSSQFNISAISQDFQEYQQNPQSIFYQQIDAQNEEDKSNSNIQMGQVMSQNRVFRIQSNNRSNLENQFQIGNHNFTNNNLSYLQRHDNIPKQLIGNTKDNESNIINNNNQSIQPRHKRVKSEETYCQRGQQNNNYIQNYSSTIQQNQSCLSYQSITSQHQQLPQPRNLAFKLHLDSLKNNESQFLLQIEELLKGGVILKKFSQFQSMKQHIFNPFLSESMPPENCGFGTRFMSLNKNLTKIEIRHPLKSSTIESIINVEQIIRCAIPQTTTELIKLQKYAATIKVQGPSKIPNINRIPISKLEGVDNIKHYSFCVVLDKEGRVEFIAQDYRAFMAWTQGINLLIKMRKQLPRLKNHIEQIAIR